MKIVIATPLYPPDTAGLASYVKDLAIRLRDEIGVTIVTYGELPEEIDGVEIRAVSKRRPLPLRLFSYTTALFAASRTADMLYVQNGASVELPATLVSFVTNKKMILHFGDQGAHVHAKKNPAFGFIEKLATVRAQKVVTGTPPVRPEILPFVPYPNQAFADYEAAWKEHLQALHTTFTI